MCSDHRNRIAWLPFVANGKGDNRRTISCEIVFAAGLES